jgi:hypothetical protein
MADITLTTLSDGAVASADAINANVYRPGLDSLDTVNGSLEQQNLAADTKVRQWMLQPGEFSQAFAAGRTVSVDYFSDLFTGFAPYEYGTPNEEGSESNFLAIPGCCKSVDLDWAPGLVLVTWTVFGTHNGYKTAALDPQQAVLCFAKDGVFVPGQRRIIPQHVFLDSATSSPAVKVRYPAVRQRVWSGQFMYSNLTSGRHDFGIYIASTAQHTRLWAGNMSVMAVW